MTIRSLVCCLALMTPIFAGCAAEAGSDGEFDVSQDGIVRGAPDLGHPQVMALMIPRFDGETAYCSATLYADRTLVTAAHCLRDAGDVLAYWGDDFWGDFEQLFEAEPNNWRFATSWEVHPGYDATTSNADIAVVQLDRPLPFPPLRLALRELGPRDLGATLEIVGWGAAGTDAETGTVPEDALVKRSGEVAYRGSPPAQPLPPNPHPGLGDARIRRQLMQLDGRAPLANSCFGDSGGPALRGAGDSQTIVGVSSWTGDFCEDFSYYVRVHDFLPFLTTRALRTRR